MRPRPRAGPSAPPPLLPLAAAAALLAGAQDCDPRCDVDSSGPVCLGGGASVLLPGAASQGLVGHWTFDEEAPYDASGNGNHAQSELQHGPAPAGGGHSAMFQKSFLLIPDSELLHTADFTYSFWVYVLDELTSEKLEAPRWCPLLRKGVYQTEAAEFASLPAILFSRKTGQLRASVTTSVSSQGDGEYVDSNARLQTSRWVHLAVVLHSAKSDLGTSRLLIYVNGILDARLVTRGKAEFNSYPLYVGGDPFTAQQCDFKLYLDDLKIYDRAVAPHELQAEAAPALPGVDPAYVHLGCLSCTLDEAIRSCPQSRHVCSALELHTGGYQIARSLGWLAGGAHVWTHAAVARRAVQRADGPGGQSADDLPSGAPGQGLALCCEGAAA